MVTVETELITAYIGLGSNKGFRAGNILLAVRGLMEAGFHVSRLSALYETEPVAVDNQRAFLNMVAEIKVANITPSQMLARMVRIEYLLGRRHKFLQAPRTIDLDLLFYGDSLVETEFLTIPHPRLAERNFVLVPLAELSPGLIHPIKKLTIQEILDSCEDESKVERWSPDPSTKKDTNTARTRATSST